MIVVQVRNPLGTMTTWLDARNVHVQSPSAFLCSALMGSDEKDIPAPCHLRNYDT